MAIVRILQDVFTNDCEYCASLAEALDGGAVVLAIKTDSQG